MQFVTIDHAELNKDQKLEMAQLMTLGSVAIKKNYEIVKAAVKQSEPSLRYHRPMFRQELFNVLSKRTGNTLNHKPVTVRGIEVPTEDIKAINAVRAVEYRIMQGYAKLMFRFAKKWSQRGGTGLGFGDFYNEIVLTVMNSIYCFKDVNIQFTTFVSTAIHRRLSHYVSNYKLLSHWTNDDKDLYAQYMETKIKAEAKRGNVPLRFEEITKIMKLDAEQQENLRDMLKGVIRESDIRTKDEDTSVDITTFAKVDERGAIDLDVKEALAKMEMSEWEKAVLDAYLEAPIGNGWRSEVASKFINPATGRHYTRAAPKITLERVLTRLKTTYFQKAA